MGKSIILERQLVISLGCRCDGVGRIPGSVPCRLISLRQALALPPRNRLLRTYAPRNHRYRGAYVERPPPAAIPSPIILTLTRSHGLAIACSSLLINLNQEPARKSLVSQVEFVLWDTRS